MSLTEHAVGHGTIAYAGESAEYWAAKSAQLRRGRARITVALAASALILLAWLAGPLGPRVETARVIGSSPTATALESSATGSSLVRVVLPDQRTADYISTTVPPVGARVTVTAFADGHVVEGDTVAASLWTIGLLLGALAVGRGVRAFRQRGLVTTFR